MGAWVIGVKMAEEVLKAYLNATFGTDEDLRRRVRKLDQMDKKK
jgi:ribose 5-phosphate isomerase B